MSVNLQTQIPLPKGIILFRPGSSAHILYIYGLLPTEDIRSEFTLFLASMCNITATWEKEMVKLQEFISLFQ